MSELVTIEEYQYVSEAEHVQSILADSGITAYLADSNILAMDWLLMPAVGGVKLRVEEKDIASAQAILDLVKQRRKDRQSGGDVTFDCENCGRQLMFPAARRGGVEVCKYCGGYVDVPED